MRRKFGEGLLRVKTGRLGNDCFPPIPLDAQWRFWGVDYRRFKYSEKRWSDVGRIAVLQSTATTSWSLNRVTGWWKQGPPQEFKSKRKFRHPKLAASAACANLGVLSRNTYPFPYQPIALY
jgi:hypothetical protein